MEKLKELVDQAVEEAEKLEEVAFARHIQHTLKRAQDFIQRVLERQE
ncbi:MAG: hypothetical protein WCS33_00070 [Candidatus Caldatribacteriota bacterium]